MKGGLGNMMKQAQRMQEEMQRVQTELAEMEVTGQAGGGMVSVVMTGRHEIRRVTIDETVYDDREMVEDLVAAAFNDAAQRLEQTTQERMSSLTEGLNLPAGMKMPF